jgi:hypothetical protein
MASILLLTMAEDGASELADLGAGDHDLECVEPRFPECKSTLEGRRWALVLVDGREAPSHGRATAGWLANQPRLRTVPFLFLDVPDKDVTKVKKEVPRAQFATWASAVGASLRLVDRK